jgi:hypothetical protein
VEKKGSMWMRSMSSSICLKAKRMSPAGRQRVAVEAAPETEIEPEVEIDIEN